MAILTRKAILDCNDNVKELVKCPEWDGDVYVKAMTGTERDAFEVAVVALPKEKRSENMRSRIAIICVCDLEGNAIFESADITALGLKSAKPLDRILDVAQRLSGMGEKDQEALLGESRADQS